MLGQNPPPSPFGHVRSVFFGRREAHVGTVETRDVFVRFQELPQPSTSTALGAAAPRRLPSSVLRSRRRYGSYRMLARTEVPRAATSTSNLGSDRSER